MSAKVYVTVILRGTDALSIPVAHMADAKAAITTANAAIASGAPFKLGENAAFNSHDVVAVYVTDEPVTAGRGGSLFDSVFGSHR